MVYGPTAKLPAYVARLASREQKEWEVIAERWALRTQHGCELRVIRLRVQLSRSQWREY
jgi:hypothetical protein